MIQTHIKFMSKSCEGLISKSVLLSSAEKIVSISYLIVPERLAVQSLVVLEELAGTSKWELTSSMSMGYLHSNLINPPSRTLNLNLSWKLNWYDSYPKSNKKWASNGKCTWPYNYTIVQRNIVFFQGIAQYQFWIWNWLRNVTINVIRIK